jgi:triosephosphate isomerase
MKKLIVANWKMNPMSAEEARRIFLGVEHRMHLYRDKAEVVVCAPFVFLPGLVHHSQFAQTGAQNLHWEESGAFTGETSVKQLVNFGVRYVILGHSERRIYFGETDSFVGIKIISALRHKIIPIVCLGGDAKASKANIKKLITKQFNAAVKGLDKRQTEKIVFVYEPTWAISTMRKSEPETGEHAAEMIGHIRAMLAKHVGAGKSASMQVLYGGSVNPANVQEFSKHPTIDGALVGAASLDPDKFIAIVKEFHRESIHKS